MDKFKKLKGFVYHKILDELDRKIEVINKAIASAKDSRNNDTKSSAGDKYETGREMMQIEIEKNEVLLNQTAKQRKELARIDITEEFNKVAFGSLVETDNGTYFISIGIGKVQVDNQTCYAISLASPIGGLLKDKAVSDEVTFQNSTFVIKGIV
ncbi:3-oxoacyl-ACP synthase [Ancylomarina sp. 16SWW S1-10-2]|uniref:3-oxoacyl-ACP synthase n=1 Tax=Ancylomarina sp. 16SWW S1-10-2 TaxID=2499681 RepID=UPI0012AD3BF7|nr:3-oxoacyl-ACP synthase [Ancylomarina sp. 16SWW S1-10-2]MRT94687.1 3-oxoacyl-ACP synthase [Ancylomarina sp. 16SWW S1-10-2]